MNETLTPQEQPSEQTSNALGEKLDEVWRYLRDASREHRNQNHGNTEIAIRCATCAIKEAKNLLLTGTARG